MKEKEKAEIQEIEQVLGIRFLEPNSIKLERLDKLIDQLAQKLKVKTHVLNLPERGFLAQPLSPEQEKEISSFLSTEYAREGLQLQDKLTNIAVQENNEKMVSLPSLFIEHGIPLSLSRIPFHEACGQWAGKPRIFWVRKSVAARVLKAGEALLSLGFTLHIEDAFRPIGVQEGLFSRRVKMILQDHPNWINEWDKVWIEARSKTAVCPWMAGHKSGAALDITLKTSEGIPLPLGNTYPEGGAKVALHYPYVTQEEWTTRQLFTTSMEMAGLRVYPYENWHASLGDLSAGISAFSTTEVTPNYRAVYGPIKDFNKTTGEIEPYQIEEYFSPFFTKEELMRSFISHI